MLDGSYPGGNCPRLDLPGSDYPEGIVQLPYSEQLRENADQQYSLYGYFSCSVKTGLIHPSYLL